METKFPDYTGKLAEFTVNKLIFIRSNFVNLFLFFYFLCFSDVLTSPSMPTKFVKLIFFYPASCLFETRYLQFVVFYYPLIISFMPFS